MLQVLADRILCRSRRTETYADCYGVIHQTVA